jgi:CRISPR-associated protein Csb2
MGRQLILAVRFHGDGQGTARYHGLLQGAPEWPPAPARLFQALAAGSARGNALPESLVPALEWLEALPPPVIAAPRANPGTRMSLFVPNNDADAVPDPRDVGGIRTKKVVHPTLIEESVPLLYAWQLPADASGAPAVIDAANNIYQLGRGIDMAWASGEILDDHEVEETLARYPGTVHRPDRGESGRTLPCPMEGSLASLVQRHRAVRFRAEGKGRAARLLFTNPPKPRFLNVTYDPVKHHIVYELRDKKDDTRLVSWEPSRVVKLVEAVRDGAVERLQAALPGDATAIDQALIGRRPDASNPGPPNRRARLIPLPSIGSEHADRGVRRILLEVPGGTAVRAVDLAWAVAGLQREEALPNIVLARAEADTMLRHYVGPSQRWRSVTAVVLPETAQRRRLEPSRLREEAKGADERLSEESRAATAVQVALRHAGVRGGPTFVHVQREPFESKGRRAEAFAAGTRFAKERLWHVELTLNESFEGPLVLGDGRFLGLGLMAPVAEPWTMARRGDRNEQQTAVVSPAATSRHGAFSLQVRGHVADDPVTLTRALRRAVMARVQSVIGDEPLGRFFSGHEPNGTPAADGWANHLAFQWDRNGHRLLIFAPHWLDRREPTWPERRSIEVLKAGLEGFSELRAGSAGRFALALTEVAPDDPLVMRARVWTSVTPYTVNRHSKQGSAADALSDDIVVECRRRRLPSPAITVLEAVGLPGRGLAGMVRLDFGVSVAGPVLLGKTRHLGGGLFMPYLRPAPSGANSSSRSSAARNSRTP